MFVYTFFHMPFVDFLLKSILLSTTVAAFKESGLQHIKTYILCIFFVFHI